MAEDIQNQFLAMNLQHIEVSSHKWHLKWN